MRLYSCLILTMAILILAHPTACTEVAYAVGPDGEEPVGYANITEYKGADVVSVTTSSIGVAYSISIDKSINQSARDSKTKESPINPSLKLNNFTPSSPPDPLITISINQSSKENNITESSLIPFNPDTANVINFSTGLTPEHIWPGDANCPEYPNAKYYLKAGNCYYNEPNNDYEKYENALRCYEEGIKLSPSDASLNADLWYGKGNTLLKLGKYNDSLVAYDITICFKPNYRNAWDAKCRILKALHYDFSYACSKAIDPG